MKLPFWPSLCILMFSSNAFALSCEQAVDQVNRATQSPTNKTELVNVLRSLNQTGQLPKQFIRKQDASAQGWRPGQSLWSTPALKGKSIGGDRFGNFEKRLPSGSYIEADLEYKGDRRGAKRIVFSSSRRFISTDHYESFQEIPACQ